MKGEESKQSAPSGGLTINAAEGGGNEGGHAAAAAADEDGERARSVVISEELAGIRSMFSALADTMVRSSLLGGSTAGGRARAPVLPLKRQLHAYVSQHSPALDPEFAATYGPALAARRARFLQDAHPAWAIFGKWLLSHTSVHSLTTTAPPPPPPAPDTAASSSSSSSSKVGGKKRTHGGDVKSEERKGGMDLLDLLWTLRNAVEAGIFFEGLDPVVDVLLPLAELDPIFLRVLVPRPPLLWALHVRPHISRIMSMLLMAFPLDVKSDDCEEDHTEGFVLLELVKHMTREETQAFVAQCGLMISSLDWNCESMGDNERNVALDVYSRTGMLPPAHVRNVLSYALQADIHRQYTAFELLVEFAGKKPEVKAALQRAVRSLTEKTLAQLYRSYADQGSIDMFECYLDPLLHVLDVAERRLTKVFLRRLARQMQEFTVCGGQTSALEYFESIAGRSLNEEDYQEVRGIIVPDSDDDDS